MRQIVGVSISLVLISYITIRYIDPRSEPVMTIQRQDDSAMSGDILMLVVVTMMVMMVLLTRLEDSAYRISELLDSSLEGCF